MRPTLRFIELSTGVRLEVAEQGDPHGLPVLLLHGLGDSWRSFETVMAHLPESLRVFAPSQRGDGDPGRPGACRTRDFAAHAAALVEALPLRRALVVGHSMGAVHAMRLAIDRPELSSGLVLAAGQLDDDVGPELHRIEVPTLVVWGDADPLSPRADQRRLLAEVAGARWLFYAGAGHAPHREEPARFAADVERFARSLAPPTVHGRPRFATPRRSAVHHFV
jgi:pimeloyl-ACP methyl ester carboxylesterase